ncbi:alpha/beta fold hydrolase [Marinicellulosiphila megalodicopiae]|uniref:alpha/beta fold hydrolase n=1 Tax=Marinicellulosiphila megalodicopiae TaxID=2724896 RepID=UPI003BB03EDE
MKSKVFLYFISALSLFSLVTIYQYHNEDMTTLVAARKAAGDELINSEAGVTRYQIFGERNTKTVILVHSFNGFLESWNPNVNSLVNAGYRVVLYDLFGRGLSDRPRVNYDLRLFRRQLASVISEVGADKVHLVGSSFGCVIVSDYANHHPEKVESIVMVGPAGWPNENGRNRLLDTPIIGELVFHYFGQQILRPKVEAYLFNLSKFHEVVEEWDTFASYPGFMRSALSTLRNSPVLDYTDGWKKLGNLGKPTMFIWGKQDVSFPYSNTEKLSKLIPHAKVVSIEDAAHWVNIEQAEEVNNAIASFLSVNNGGL